MATNIFEIAYLNPLKFYASSNTPGKNFDEDWYYNRLLDWQLRVSYLQKWQTDDMIKIQAISTFTGPTLTLYSLAGYPISGKTVTGTLINFDSAGNGIYEFNMALNDVPEGRYALVAKSSLGAASFVKLSEPIEVRATHKNTSLFTYTNTLNDFGIMFTGVDQDANPYAPSFTFRCEAWVLDLQPERDRTSYQDQTLNERTLYALPYRKFKLYVGTAVGVAEYVLDILNRIFCCDNVKINGLQFETIDGATWNINRVKGYPLVGADIDVIPAVNASSDQQNDVAGPGGGFFTAYDIYTDAFGTFNAPPDSNEIVLEDIS